MQAVTSPLRLTNAEAWEVLARTHTGILVSLRRDGVPVALPVWFVTLDERIYVTTPVHTKKLARVRHDPRVAFVVESGERWAELVGIHLTGAAHVVTDPELLERVAAALDAKYRTFRTERAGMPAATRAYYDTPTATIEIVPDARLLTWDNARLFQGDVGGPPGPAPS